MQPLHSACFPTAQDLKTATEEAEKLAAELKQKRKEAEEASKKSQAAWEAVEKLTQGSGAVRTAFVSMPLSSHRTSISKAAALIPCQLLGASTYPPQAVLC